jgi:hypothetical protein
MINIKAGTRLEKMELRLKAELLEESQHFEGRVMVHDEIGHQQITPLWESVKSG